MPHFRYKAYSSTGAIIRGVLDAPTESAVVQHLRGAGHTPISAAPDRFGPWLVRLSHAISWRRGLSLRALGLATQELASLLDAGIELDRALGILGNLRDAASVREAFATARERVRDGANLADAMARNPLFPRFYVAMVRAGETGGNLGPTLQRLADYLARTVAVRETIASALVYPAILLITAGVSIIFILTVVLPQFEQLFADAGKALPLPTRIVMGVGHVVQDFWWLFALVIIGCWIALRRAFENREFRWRFDNALLRVPVLGTLLRDIEVERFCRCFGTLVAQGVSVPGALTLVEGVVSNKAIARAVSETAASLREGDSLARRLARYGFFAGATLDLVQIGEETGKLDEMLLRQAEFEERRIRQTLGRLLALLVPGLTLLLGLVVAGLIASMLVAILSVNDLALQ